MGYHKIRFLSNCGDRNMHFFGKWDWPAGNSNTYSSFGRQSPIHETVKNCALVLSTNTMKKWTGKNMCTYLGVLYSQNFCQLFLLDSHGTYCVYFQTIEHFIYFEVIQWVQKFASKPFWQLFVKIVAQPIRTKSWCFTFTISFFKRVRWLLQMMQYLISSNFVVTILCLSTRDMYKSTPRK